MPTQICFIFIFCFRLVLMIFQCVNTFYWVIFLHFSTPFLPILGAGLVHPLHWSLMCVKATSHQKWPAVYESKSVTYPTQIRNQMSISDINAYCLLFFFPVPFLTSYPRHNDCLGFSLRILFSLKRKKKSSTLLLPRDHKKLSLLSL